MTDSDGLYYMRARYYSPILKRFINSDPLTGTIQDSRTLNKYAYANGNPVSMLDPFGTSADNWSAENTGLATTNLLNKYVFSRLAELIAGGKNNVLYSSLKVAGLRSEALLLGLNDMIMSPINAVRNDPASIWGMLDPSNMGIGIVNTVSTLFDSKQANNWWLNSDASLDSLTNYGGAYSSAVVTAASVGVGIGESIEADGAVAATEGAGNAASGFRTVDEAGISSSDALRIQNAANKTGQRITVVGSRANETATDFSDWDYILSGNSAQRHSAISSLPSGLAGGEYWSGIDIWTDYPNSGAANYTTLHLTLLSHMSFLIHTDK